MAILAELRNLGLADVCIVAFGGLRRGLPEAVGEIWPQATMQLCVVHRSRQEITRCFSFPV